MTVQEVIQVLESDGWRLTKNDETLRQLKHDSKPGTVTLAGKLDLAVPRGLLRNLWRLARIEEAD